MKTDLIGNKNPFVDRNLYIIISITLISIMGGPTIAPMLPDLAKVFDVSSKEIELVMIVFFLPIGIATPILGILADRIGIRKVLVPSLLLFAIAGGCSSFAQDFQTLLWCRFLQGLGVASLDFIVLIMISMLYRGKALRKAMSLNIGILGLSAAIYPIMGGALANFSWRAPFLLTVTAFPLVMLILMVLKLPQKPSSSQNSNLKIYLQNIWHITKNPAVLGLMLVRGSIFAIQFGAFITYLPILAGNNLGASGLLIGLILTSMSLSLSVVASQMIRLAPRTSEITLIKLSFVIIAIALSIIPAIHHAWMLIFPSMLFGVAQALAMPSSQALLAGLAADNARAGFMAINASVQSLGQAVGPLIAGISLEFWDIDGVFWASAGISLTTFVLFDFLITPKQKITPPLTQPATTVTKVVSQPKTVANTVSPESTTTVNRLTSQPTQTRVRSTPSKTPPVKPSITQSAYNADSHSPTILQIQSAWLIHLPTESIVELPNNIPQIRLGKANKYNAPDIDLSLFPNSGVVSRRHADIRVEGDRYYIEDMGSSNGTYLNQYPLLPGNWYKLRFGDRVSFGKGDLVNFIFQGVAQSDIAVEA